jgi:hypothetical protein
METMKPLADPRPRKLVTYTGVLIAIATSIVLAAPLIAGRHDPEVDDPSIRSAITEGLLAAQTAPLAPKSAQGKKLSKETIGQIRQKGRDKLSKFYARSAFDDRMAALDSGVAEQASGEIVFLDSGIDNVVVSDLVVTGDTATATAIAEVWLDVAQVQPDGTLATAHPRNTMLLDLSLAWDGGVWKIVGQTGTFSPGSQP